MSIVTATDVTGSAPSAKQTDTIGSSPAPVAAASTEAPKEDQRAQLLAQMAKKEKALRDAQRALSAEKEQLQARIQESEKSWKEQLRAQLLQDAHGTLQNLGIGYDQITQSILNAGNPEDLKFQALQREIQNLKLSQEQAAENAKKASQEQEQQIMKQMRTEVGLLVDGNEEFETIKAMEAEDSVVELIKQTFDQDGVLMNVSDAAKEVEKYLFEKLTAWTQLKKLQAKSQPAAAEPTPTEATPQQSTQRTQTTLSNRQTASGRPMTARERRERAIAAFKGQQLT